MALCFSGETEVRLMVWGEREGMRKSEMSNGWMEGKVGEEREREREKERERERDKMKAEASRGELLTGWR
jgi:hypothetical protein